MKASQCAFAAMLGCALVANSAFGQTLKHPTSVRPASLSSDSYYGYYYGDEEAASPSDTPAEPQAAEPQAAEPQAVAPVEPAPVSSDTPCSNGCNPCCGSCGDGSCYLLGPDEAWTVFGNDNRRGIKAGFWTQLGYHSESDGLFNDLPDRVNLHQQWFWIGKEADGSCGWDWGFRFDAIYGIDGTDTQAFGNNAGVWDYQNGFDHGIYSWALPQLYAELANGDFSVKVGHFFTLEGYEVVPATGNFFYSHAFTMYNSEPFTHTGAVATYGVNDDLEVYFGWTAGWDTGFDRYQGGSNFLGGFAYNLTDDVKFIYTTTAGNLGFRGDGYTHSAIFDVNITEKLNYVFETDLVATNGTFDSQDRYLPGQGNNNVGINQYLFYHLNDCVALGTRAEWWKSDGVSYNEVTFGVNYRPMANVVFRPEVREQWSPAMDEEEFIFGIDTVVIY